MIVRWPVTLQSGPIRLRQLTRRDGPAWYELRRNNVEWLRPWEATLPYVDPSIPATFAGMVRGYRREGRAGRAMAFGLEYEVDLVGQVTLGGISWGSLRSAHIGYWISRHVAGHGIMPRAVAMVTDFAFTELHLHRIEINIRPENTSSRRVAEKLGFRLEGQRPQYLHIDGDWRDHVCYTMLATQQPQIGLLRHTELFGWAEPAADEREQTVSDTGESVPRMRPPHP